MKGERDQLSDSQAEFHPWTPKNQAALKPDRAREIDLSTEDLQAFLVGRKIKLDCGHCATPGHNFANTIIVVSLGGGRIETSCSECGY